MKIYFAGSIRGGRDNRELYCGIISLLQKYGTVLTEHIGNQTLSDQGEFERSDELIFKRDVKLLDECDVVIAEVTTPSLGVGYEIGRIENKKPILCIYQEQENKKLSAMLAGNDNLQTERYETLSDVDKLLEEFTRNLNLP